MRPDRLRVRDRPPDGPEGSLQRSYLEGELPLSGVTVILGANSSGKTSLLELAELELADEDWSDEYGRILLRIHPDTHPDVLIRADLSEGSADIGLLRRISTQHPRYDTVGDVYRSFANITFPRALAVAVYETNREFGLNDERRPSMEELRACAEQEVFQVVRTSEGLKVALAPPTYSQPEISFGARYLGPVPEELAPFVVPPIVVAPAELADVSELAEGQVRKLIDRWLPGILPTAEDLPEALPEPDGWLMTDEDGAVSVAPGVREIVELLEHELQRLLPSFVAHEGDVRIIPLSPEYWRGGARVSVGIRRGGELRRAEAFGSGTRRWVAICLLVAARRMRQGPPSRATEESVRRLRSKGGFHRHPRAPGPSPILLIDEPELHLHPEAAQDVAAWLSRRVGTGDIQGAIVATHSPSMLRVESDDLNIVLLRRGTETTHIEPIDEDVLNTLDQAAVSQGFGRDAWFFATRSVLLVEGEDDVSVLQRFFGQRLSRLRVRPLALRGARNVRRLVESKFLGASGIPLHALLDNLLVERVRHAEDPTELTDEERIAWSVIQQAPTDDLEFLSYPEPDILCALPLQTVGRRYPHLASRAEELADSNGYWSELIAEWRDAMEKRGTRLSFKRWVATEVFGLKHESSLVSELVNSTLPTDEPSPPLATAIDELAAHLSNRDLWR